MIHYDLRKFRLANNLSQPEVADYLIPIWTKKAGIKIPPCLTTGWVRSEKLPQKLWCNIKHSLLAKQFS